MGQQVTNQSIPVHRLVLLAECLSEHPGHAACKRSLSEPMAIGCISSPAQGYPLAPTCSTTYQPAKSAANSLMLQWFRRARCESGRIWPCGNNRSCSVFFPLSRPCSWHLQTHLSWPSLQRFNTLRSAYHCALGNTDFIVDHHGNKAKQGSPQTLLSEALCAAGSGAGSKNICGRAAAYSEKLRKTLCLKHRAGGFLPCNCWSHIILTKSSQAFQTKQKFLRLRVLG